MKEILGIVARSIIRHAVVGVLTGGVGNILLLAGDAMDISETMDASDAMDAISSTDVASSTDYSSGVSHDHEVHFGGKLVEVIVP